MYAPQDGYSPVQLIELKDSFPSVASAVEVNRNGSVRVSMFQYDEGIVQYGTPAAVEVVAMESPVGITESGGRVFLLTNMSLYEILA